MLTKLRPYSAAGARQALHCCAINGGHSPPHRGTPHRRFAPALCSSAGLSMRARSGLPCGRFGLFQRVRPAASAPAPPPALLPRRAPRCLPPRLPPRARCQGSAQRSARRGAVRWRGGSQAARKPSPLTAAAKARRSEAPAAVRSGGEAEAPRARLGVCGSRAARKRPAPALGSVARRKPSCRAPAWPPTFLSRL